MLEWLHVDNQLKAVKVIKKVRLDFSDLILPNLKKNTSMGILTGAFVSF